MVRGTEAWILIWPNRIRNTAPQFGNRFLSSILTRELHWIDLHITPTDLHYVYSCVQAFTNVNDSFLIWR